MQNKRVRLSIFGKSVHPSYIMNFPSLRLPPPTQRTSEKGETEMSSWNYELWQVWKLQPLPPSMMIPIKETWSCRSSHDTYLSITRNNCFWCFFFFDVRSFFGNISHLIYSRSCCCYELAIFSNVALKLFSYQNYWLVCVLLYSIINGQSWWIFFFFFITQSHYWVFDKSGLGFLGVQVVVISWRVKFFTVRGTSGETTAND